MLLGKTGRGFSLSELKQVRRKSSAKAERRADMIEQILDAAEFLFSRHGLYGVALKDVAQRIGVHHTLINYYFDDKRKLFDAVFARRAVMPFRSAQATSKLSFFAATPLTALWKVSTWPG